MNEAMTLDELSSEVQSMLGSRGLLEAQQDGRVAPAPDARTIRYYTTLGLLDRPKIVEREARYGPRHVLQLCAIKALQVAGLALADVQSRLYGRSNAELEALLFSVAETRRARPVEVRTLTWREVTIEPGLKILVEHGWTPRMSQAALQERVAAALGVLGGSSKLQVPGSSTDLPKL